MLSREALYERVWSEPVRTVAESFGLSDVGLRKVCVRADVPLPERGYWAKLRSGKPVARLKLPPRGQGMPERVSVGAEPYRSYWPRSIGNLEAELAEPLPEQPVFDEPIDDVRARVAQRVGHVRFERNLNAGHALVRTLLAKDDVRRPKPGDPSWRSAYDKPLFDSGLERHRLRILSSLFLALQKFGAHPSMRGATGRDLGVSVGIETVHFTLDHPSAKADRFGEWKTWPGTIDVLKLSVAGAGGRVWLDTEEDRLESHLDEVVVHLIVAGEMNYRADVESAFERAVSRRREAEAELEKARAEARRKAREARLTAEARRRKELLAMAADLRAADDIRALVRRVTDAREGEEGEPSRLWGRWALEVAARLDPTERLRFESGGRAPIEEPSWPDPDDRPVTADGCVIDVDDEGDDSDA